MEKFYNLGAKSSLEGKAYTNSKDTGLPAVSVHTSHKLSSEESVCRNCDGSSRPIELAQCTVAFHTVSWIWLILFLCFISRYWVHLQRQHGRVLLNIHNTNHVSRYLRFFWFHCC